MKQISEIATEMPAQETEDSLKENETVREAHHSFEISLVGFPQPDRALLSPTVANKILSSFDPVFSPPPNQQV
ncbi:MAG: hypothetical protein KIT80_06380 [Chitinophagaceae bacterium]|nr:hypothetical protein [Chitinophagaceae bacterium]MCW5926522.1 hypothetical protein [Chitinophagaceae bacterium]